MEGVFSILNIITTTPVIIIRYNNASSTDVVGIVRACVIRTTSPSFFHGNRDIMRLNYPRG